jgi:two-component system cell cycle response regulator
LSTPRNLPQILLVEEDPKLSEVLAGVIREVTPCRLDQVNRIQSLLEGVLKANYHLVVIDASGEIAKSGQTLRVLEQIRQASPGTAVLIMTDQPTVEEAVSSIRRGAEDYFKKPFDLESFQLAIKRSIDRKTVYSGERGVERLVQVLNTCQLISATLDITRVFEILENYFRRELRAEIGAIYSLIGSREGETQSTEASPLGNALEGGSSATPMRPIRVHPTQDDRGLLQMLDISIQTTSHLEEDPNSSSLFRMVKRGALSPALFFFRFRCAGPEDFLFVALSPHLTQSASELESHLRLIRAQLELTGKNIEQYRGVQDLVYVDEVTGLFNSRYLENTLDRWIAEVTDGAPGFAVLFIDVDHFKRVNDQHGHVIGSKILKEMGERIQSQVRDTDLIFRYGGDEFIALLKGADLSTAMTVGERIRKAVEQSIFLKDEALAFRTTVSVGVALFPEHAISKRDILEAADYAMYSAKRSQRNRVCLAERAVK